MTSYVSCAITDRPYRLDDKCLNDALTNGKTPQTTAFIRNSTLGNYLVSGNIKCPEDPLCKCAVENFAVISSKKCFYNAQGQMVCDSNTNKSVEKSYDCKVGPQYTCNNRK